MQPVGSSTADWDEASIWEVIGIDTSPSQGQHVQKVGIATGHTYGQVSHVCYHYDEDNSDFKVNCLIEVSRPSGVGWNIADSGDSGGPVFWRPYHNKVLALGIVFGGDTEGEVEFFWATPINEAMNGEGMSGGTFNFTYNGLSE